MTNVLDCICERKNPGKGNPCICNRSETTLKEKMICYCGRSPGGYCLSYHSLSWKVYAEKLSEYVNKVNIDENRETIS